MECVIKSVRHSGTSGERNSLRTDGRYPMRVGRVVEIDPSTITAGRSLVFDYVRDRDGTDLSGSAVITTKVVDFVNGADSLVFETLNTIYEMAKC